MCSFDFDFYIYYFWDILFFFFLFFKRTLTIYVYVNCVLLQSTTIRVVYLGQVRSGLENHDTDSRQ